MSMGRKSERKRRRSRRRRSKRRRRNATAIQTNLAISLFALLECMYGGRKERKKAGTIETSKYLPESPGGEPGVRRLHIS